MLPIGTFGPWAPTQPPPRNLLTVLTDGEQNVTRRRHAAKPKLKVRKTRIADENKHPSSSNGTFASFFRTTSSESSYVSATSQRSSDPLQKDENVRPPTSIGVAPSTLRTPQAATQRNRSRGNRVFTKVLEGLQKRSSGNSTTSVSSSSLTPDFFTPRNSFESAHSSNAQTPGPILRAGISVTAEVEAFDLRKGGSIWTAVQVRGKVFDKGDNATSFLNKSVDMAIIVDNSKFASAQCLESACSQALHLVKLLQSPGDRLAVFSTVCRHGSDSIDSPGGCQLYQLAPPKIHAVEKELQALLEPSRNAMLFNPSFFDTLVAAHNALESVDEGYDLNTRRSIVILTPNPAALAEVAQVTSIRIHVICPGPVPYTSPLSERFNGCLLNTGIIPMPDTFEDRVDRLKTHLQNIDDLVSYERSMCSIGEVSNLFLYIKAGAGATIEEVVGDLWYRSLHPGQTISLLVKVKVKPIAPADDPFTNLELMLGEVLSELFQIELVHDHSFFPGSDITTRATCWLLRHNGDSEQYTQQGRLRNDRRSSWIRSILAYQQACIRPHRDALNALEKLLRRNDFRHYLSLSHVMLLREELTIQLGVAADEYLITHVERGDTDSPTTVIHRRVW